ncbi:MAG: HEPN domain-containing protein [Bacteroidia bacterium]|jgi:uncharacterized protein
MSPEERSEYIQYRIKTAQDTFDAAKVLAENGFWNSAVNRLYYSVFYAVNALLVQNEIFSSSHSGLRSQFSLHYIKTGRLDRKYGNLLSQLYDWRQKADYGNVFDFDPESVKPRFDDVLDMIREIEKEIAKTS